MNRKFAEHVTSTAFFLSVSKKQMNYLLALESAPWKADNSAYDAPYYVALRLANLPGHDTFTTSLRKLEEKGLVRWVVHDRKKEWGHWEMTRAGTLVCDLLREAGLAQSLTAQERAA